MKEDFSFAREHHELFAKEIVHNILKREINSPGRKENRNLLRIFLGKFNFVLFERRLDFSQQNKALFSLFA